MNILDIWRWTSEACLGPYQISKTADFTKTVTGFQPKYTLFFIWNTLFSTMPHCCLTFSWIGLQVLLRCCLIHISIITLKHFLYLLYLCPCLDLCLFMSNLCDVFFIFIFIFIMTNIMNTSILVSLLIFQNMSYFLVHNVDKKCKQFSNSKSSASGCCLVFAWLFANISQVLFIKMLLIKKKRLFLYYLPWWKLDSILKTLPNFNPSRLVHFSRLY